ncbi:MAG: hypothetical protein PVSMB1_06460 [Gemmatimonadaceae bacterium]
MADCFLLHAFQDRFTHEFFIKGACPERKVVEAVYASACRLSGPGGTVAVGISGVAAAARCKVSDREAESSLRLLEAAGAVTQSSGSSNRAHVRMTATPARIRSELGEDESRALDLLRALWRLTRGAIANGTVVDLDVLPPGLSGGMGAGTLLDELEGRQMLVWSRVGEGITVTDRSAPLTRWTVDWESLGERRRAETTQLDLMQKYSYTGVCRRGFVLSYFGDPAATAHCEQCDNCLSIEHAAETARAPRHRPGRRTREPRGVVTSRPEREKRGPALTPPDMTDHERSLLKALRALRTSIARRDSVPAFVVFSDRSLQEMARAPPRSVDALADLHGVGPAKLKKYGAAILEVLRVP